MERLVESDAISESDHGKARMGALFFLILPGALVPAMLNPGVVGIGLLYPGVWRGVLLAVMASALCIGVHVGIQLRSGTGRWAVLYIYERRGRTFLGTRFGGLLPWRRVPCGGDVVLDLGAAPSRHDRSADRPVRVTVMSGRRRLRVRSPRPISRASASGAAARLRANGVSANVGYGAQLGS